MATTSNTYYNPSVNIARDLGNSFDYIPTPNARLVFKELVKQYYNGTHSFTIVGAYGTGKSSFLLALEKEFNNKKSYFSTEGQFAFKTEFEVIPFVGDFKSIVSSFAERFGLKDNKKLRASDIINEIDNIYQTLNKSGKGLAIYIDEFGKFLEFATKNNPEAELYFIQQLAELANDPEKDILFVTTLHRGFSSYSNELTESQKKEWNKVSGRLAELTFNEPLEQLLLLASQRLDGSQKEIPGAFKALFKIIEQSKVFPLRDFLDSETAQKLFPFDILAAAFLASALQRYGQNQRSLFSFIDSNSHLSIRYFDSKQANFYNLVNVYDYLNYNYFSFLSTKYNPDYADWAAIKNSIERVEGIFDEGMNDAINIVKIVGLCQIFSHKGAVIDKEFITKYTSLSLGSRKPAETLKFLEQHKIILFSGFNRKYRLFEGTDVNIELAIDEAGNLIQKIGNVVDYLNRSFDFPYILAKEAFYRKGTPRYFGFHLSEEPEIADTTDEIDGYINLIFNEDYKEEDLHKYSGQCNEPTLFGWYTNTKDIKKHLFEIEKVKKAIDVYKDDAFALKEFTRILEHQTNILNHYILDELYGKHGKIIWSFKGEKVEINTPKTFNKVLSQIVYDVYSKIPILKNELFNKTKISSAIAVARKNLIVRLVENSGEKDLGFKHNEFPPEKTIYLTLLKNVGIHKGGGTFSEPTDKSYIPIWQEGIDFLNKSKLNHLKVSELVEIYSAKPYKLKRGFIDFWLPIFLYIQKEKYALYEDRIFVPHITSETLELIIKRPDHYEIKAFDIEGKRLDLFNKYRYFLNQIEESTPTNESFIETFKPFITFYRGLSYYCLHTKKISKKSISLREAIGNAKDPEVVFFEELPKALGYATKELINDDGKTEEFVISLRNSIQEINQAYDNLINRIESFILKKIVGKQVEFPSYREELIKRFAKIKKHQLNTKQKALIQRLKSPLEDRKSWLNSLSYAVINKSLENINDEEEILFYDALTEKIHELDNLCELSNADVDEQNEEVYKIEITSFVKGLEKRLIRLPKQNTKEILSLTDIIKSQLKGNSKDLNIALLTKLLQEQLNNE